MDDGHRETGPVEETGLELYHQDGMAFSRRQFLKVAAGGAALSAAATMTRGQMFRQAKRIAAENAAFTQLVPVPDIFISATRDVDLALLDFSFFGFQVQPGAPPAIVPTRTTNHIVVGFPPQAIGEAVYPVNPFTHNYQFDPPPILSDVAGPSRLVFSLGFGRTIPLPTMTVADLLDWSRWDLEVPSVALTYNISGDAQTIAVPRLPRSDETQIECPYALYLSPTQQGTFTGRQQPLTVNSLTDCWSAVLGGDPRVVATYARDYPGSGVPNATPWTNIDYTPFQETPH